MVQRIIVRTVIALTMLLMLLLQDAGAATVTVADLDMDVGLATAASLIVTLTNAPGDTVAGGQFDLEFDPGVMTLIGVTAGMAATAADKTVSYSEIEPGVVRIIIMGMNLDVMGDGELAELTFLVAAGTDSGGYPVDVTGLVLSDAYGNAEPAVADSGAINVNALPLPVDRGGWLTALLLAAVAAHYLMGMDKRNAVPANKR